MQSILLVNQNKLCSVLLLSINAILPIPEHGYDWRRNAVSTVVFGEK